MHTYSWRVKSNKAWGFYVEAWFLQNYRRDFVCLSHFQFQHFKRRFAFSGLSQMLTGENNHHTKNLNPAVGTTFSPLVNSARCLGKQRFCLVWQLNIAQKTNAILSHLPYGTRPEPKKAYWTSHEQALLKQKQGHRILNRTRTKYCRASICHKRLRWKWQRGERDGEETQMVWQVRK